MGPCHHVAIFRSSSEPYGRLVGPFGAICEIFGAFKGPFGRLGAPKTYAFGRLEEPESSLSKAHVQKLIFKSSRSKALFQNLAFIN